MRTAVIAIAAHETARTRRSASLPTEMNNDPKPQWKGVLVETCMENGVLTEAQIDETLAGTKERKEMRAVMSLLECFIGEAHAETRQRGQEQRIRDEASGAARYLCDLREQLIEKTREKKPRDEEAEQ